MKWYKKHKLAGGQATLNYRELEKRLKQMGITKENRKRSRHATYRDAQENLITLPPHWGEDVPKGIIDGVANQMRHSTPEEQKKIRELLLEKNKKARKRYKKQQLKDIQEWGKYQSEPIPA